MVAARRSAARLCQLFDCRQFQDGERGADSAATHYTPAGYTAPSAPLILLLRNVRDIFTDERAGNTWGSGGVAVAVGTRENEGILKAQKCVL